MQKFVRFRFHLSSGARVDRYQPVKEGETIDREDIENYARAFRYGLADAGLVDTTGGFLIPATSALLFVEIDVVDKIPVDTH